MIGMIAMHTIAYSLGAFFTYVYLELYFQLGVITSSLITIYLFYHRFYILPLLLLSLNVFAFFSGQENLLHLTAALLVIHLLFSAPKQKILEKTFSVTREEIKIVNGSKLKGNDDKSSDGSSSPEVISVTVTESVTARNSLVDATVDEDQQSPSQGKNSRTNSLIKRRTPKMSQADRDLIAAARAEAKRAEEERRNKYISGVLSPKEKK